MKSATTLRPTAFAQAAFVCAELPIKHPCPESGPARPHPPGEAETTARVLEPDEETSVSEVAPPPKRVRAYKRRTPSAPAVSAETVRAHEPLAPRERPQETVEGLIEDASTAPDGHIWLQYGRLRIEVFHDRDTQETGFTVNGWPVDRQDCERYLTRIQAGLPVRAP